MKFVRTLLVGLITSIVIANAGYAGIWQPLFNGENLDGWKVLGSPEWKVEDGAIKVNGVGDQMGWLLTEKSYSDFVFRARFKWSGGNSGIQVRSRVEDGKMIGYQCNLDPGRPTATGSLVEENGRGMLKATKITANKVFKKDQWNTYEITAIGDRIEIKVNGQLMISHNDPKGDKKGIIALQMVTSPESSMEWTDLRILEIPNKQDWVSMFDGKSLTGWKTLGDSIWSIADKTIKGESDKGGYGWLLSEKEYSNFHCSLQFKIASGNSGIQFRSWAVDDMVHGFQADIDPSSDWITGHLYDQSEKGILVKPKFDSSKILDLEGWNTYEITAIGPDVELFINGIKTIEHNDPTRKKGIFAFQIHKGIEMVTYWKDIRIIEF